MAEKMPVRIVPMAAEHLDEVAELEKICFSDPWSRALLAESLEDELSSFFAALDEDGKIAAYAGIQVVLDEGYIDNIAVRPDCRRRGVAGRLLQGFLNFAAEKHLAFLTLEVRPSNAPAIALYEKYGFHAAGRRKRYYEHPAEDALIMTRMFQSENTGF